MAWGATAGERENELFQESMYICVASFRSEKKAKAMSTDLTVADYEVIVQSALVDGYDHYRVLVGPVPADKEFQKDGSISEDIIKDNESEIQKITDRHIDSLNVMQDNKEKELLEN